MSDDPEIEKIKARKLQEMIDAQKQQSQSQSQSQQQHASHSHNSADAGIVDLLPGTFDNVISSDRPTLVDFWASWCGPCKTMHPVFESINAEYPDITFARVNVDACPEIAARLSVQSIPTFVMFRSGALVERTQGAIGAPGLRAICSRV